MSGGDTGSDISAKRPGTCGRDEEPATVRESSGRTERGERGDVPARKQGRENSGIPEDDKGVQVWSGTALFLNEVVKEASTDNT